MTWASPVADAGRDAWAFRIYVLGDTVTGARSVKALRAILDERVGRDAELQVVDLQAEPERALQDQILAVPTVERLSPLPTARIIGDLSDAERVVSALGLPEDSRG